MLYCFDVIRSLFTTYSRHIQTAFFSLFSVSKLIILMKLYTVIVSTLVPTSFIKSQTEIYIFRLLYTYNVYV